MVKSRQPIKKGEGDREN